MKRIALIQFRERPEMVSVEQKEYSKALGEGADLVAFSSLDENLPWDNPGKILGGFDAVILGGSGEFDLNGGRASDDPALLKGIELKERVRPLVDYILENDFPTLAVCFGHQIIGDLQGGKVENDNLQKKIGSHLVALKNTGKEDRLFKSLPEEFIAQYGHKDSLTILPEGATVLATGKSCNFSALRYGNNVYTVQFHPELTASDVRGRLENSPGYLPEGVSVDSLVKDSPEASTIIDMFIKRISR